MFAKRFVVFLTFTIFVGTLALWAGGTASPYSRYGYGEWQSNSFAITQSMGGVGYGIRSNRVINSMNPASYSAVDSLSFMMDLGVSGTVDGFKTANMTATQFDGNLDFVAFQFPLAKWAALSFGVAPQTVVGYNYYFIDEMPSYGSEDTISVKQAYDGTGGMSYVYLGLSFDIADRFAVGVNGRYLFGSIKHNRQVTFPNSALFESTTQTEAMYISAWQCDFGVQYHQPIGKDQLVIGASYGLALPMHNRTEIVTITNETHIDDSAYAFDYPQTVGAGVSYDWQDRLLVAFDFGWQNFENARFYGEYSLHDRFVYAVGAQYTHAPGSKRYVDNMDFRLGFNYSNSYVAISKGLYDKWAITWGIGFPLHNALSRINLHMEYGQQGTIEVNKLLERYFKIGLSVSLNERWFVKRKFQ